MKTVAAYWLRLVPCLLVTGCTGWQSALDAHGTSAINIKHLIFLIVGVCSVVWMLVMMALIGALWRRRQVRSRPTDLNERTEQRMTRSVVTATIATVVVIASFTIASFLTTRALGVAEGSELNIRVRGAQWWWNVEYLDTEPGKRFQTANEIHIPVGKNIRLYLEGDDVIHSFWVPSLAGKQDLIPGRHNELLIRAERSGVYRGQCAEFCGLQHAHMGFLVIAEPEADFQQWAEAQRRPAISDANEEIAAGRTAFVAKACASCHTVRGTQAAGTTGPDLTHVGSRQMIAAGLFDTSRGSLAAWIADPQTLKPGNNMPWVPLAPDELRAISAYMASLK